MNSKLDTLIVRTRIINRSERKLACVSSYHNAHTGFFPDTLPDTEHSITPVQFQARPNLNGGILIDVGVKKTIFESQCIYKDDRLVYEIKTSLLYAYEYVAYQQAPKAFFFWTHSAESIGTETSIARSELVTHSRAYPYSYSVDFYIG